MKKMKFYTALVLTLLLISCGSDDPAPVIPPTQDLDLSETTIWTGPTVVFQKSSGGDPSAAENRDVITPNVIITRGNSGGQIYNAASENSANKNTSPAGTLWARGTTDNLQNLEFSTFRGTLAKPKDNVGVNLVLLLVEDNIALDITFTSWSQQEAGGFAYERSSME